MICVRRVPNLTRFKGTKFTSHCITKFDISNQKCGAVYLNSINRRSHSSSDNKPGKAFKSEFRKMAESQGDWIDAGVYKVFPWSISGLETSVVVKGDKLCVAFDMGYPFRESVQCQNVFISHGHIDHHSGIMQHASRRALFSMPRATYHMPQDLIDSTRTVHQAFVSMQGDTSFLQNLSLRPAEIGESIELGAGWHVVPFPTVHRVPSQGYIAYHKKKCLKPEYKGLPGPEIGALFKQGEDMYDYVTTPEIAYTGDTTFEVFTNPPTSDLLKAKVLITEATYIDPDIDSNGKSSINKARERGHCHMLEFVENAQLFKDTQHLVFIHMSDKYSPGYIRSRADLILPDSLKSKVHLGTQLKERTMGPKS